MDGQLKPNAVIGLVWIEIQSINVAYEITNAFLSLFLPRQQLIW